MNCNEALQIMLDPSHAERQAALDFVMAHPECLARVDKLSRAILSSLDNEVSCAQVQSQMADYYIEEAATPVAAQHFPDFQEHLERCPYCRAEYAELRETMRALEAGALPLPESPPRFDLSFIQQPLPRQTPADAIWQTLEKVHKLFADIQVTISQGAATIGALTAEIQPHTFSPAMRSGDSDVQSSTIAIPDADAAIHFQIDIKPSLDGTALVTLSIVESDTDVAVADARVALRTAAGSLVTESLTDANGTVEFPRIAADRYVIHVRHAGQRWELPLSVSN